MTPPVAIINVGPRNLTSTQLSGFDLNISRSLDSRVGAFDFKLDASYILRFDQALVQGAETARLVNKVGNPAALRARSTIAWREYSSRGYGGQMSFDYTGAYKDNVSPNIQAIQAAFTTDVDVSYRSGPGTKEWDNIELDLSISNVFNQNPPFVDRLEGYDVANARPYGRVIGLYLTKSW